MNFIFKKTYELTEQELSEICVLFERVFDKQRTVEELLRQYVNNPLGYSYMSIMKDEEGSIVGFNSYVPVYYTVNGNRRLFANSIDSMVDKKYRDFFNFKTIVDQAYKGMKSEGVVFVYGYPNDNSFPVLTKAKLMKEIGQMYTYCLPFRIGGIKNSFKFLNPLSELFCRCFAGVASLFANSKEVPYCVKKEEDSYNASRYQRSDGKYNIEKVTGEITVYYKIKNHEGIRTAFLIDISCKSPKAFNIAVKHIIKNHSKEFDLLLYPGRLPFLNTGMIRIPRKFEPKKFNLTGKILDKEVIPQEIWDINNWDTNLSNYDLI